MQSKNSRKKPDIIGLAYSALALSALLLLSQCKDATQEQPKGNFSLESFFSELKHDDSTSEILLFKPGSPANVSNEILVRPHLPPQLREVPSNITWLKETENTRKAESEYKVDFRTEYWLQNGHVVMIKRTDSTGDLVKTVEYGANGLPVEVATVYPDKKNSLVETYAFAAGKNPRRIVTHDASNTKVLTRDFNYDSSGHLIDMIAEDKDGKKFKDFYYVDEKNTSALTVRIDDKQNVLWAAYIIRDSLGNPVYEEQYVKVASMGMLTKKNYQYGPKGDLELLQVIRPRRDTTRFAFTYPEKDSSGFWKKKWTFKGADVIGITEREMK